MKTAEGKVASIHHSGIYTSAPSDNFVRCLELLFKITPNKALAMFTFCLLYTSDAADE
mgnify:CR=1 FL=1